MIIPQQITTKQILGIRILVLAKRQESSLNSTRKTDLASPCIDIISKKWILLVVNEIENHKRIRFTELQRELKGITAKSLMVINFFYTRFHEIYLHNKRFSIKRSCILYNTL